MRYTIGILGALSQVAMLISCAILLFSLPVGILLGWNGDLIGWYFVKSFFSSILTSFFYCAMVDIWEKHFE
jgi:hypothetical protein